MKTLRGMLDLTLELLGSGSFLVMVALTCWQVFTRYILDAPSPWSEELVGFLFAWMSLFGACLVTGERSHMNIPILVDMADGGLKKALLCLGEVIAFVFSAVILVWGGVQITRLAMGQMTSSLGVAVGVFYAAMPLCGGINLIYTVMNIAQILGGEERGAV